MITNTAFLDAKTLLPVQDILAKASSDPSQSFFLVATLGSEADIASLPLVCDNMKQQCRC